MAGGFKRDPLSVYYDGYVERLMGQAERASRSRRSVRVYIASPRAEYAHLDRGGRTAHERAFTRSAYHLVWRTPINEGREPTWALELRWADQVVPSSRGRLARLVLVRLRRRSERTREARWGMQSMPGGRADDLLRCYCYAITGWVYQQPTGRKNGPQRVPDPPRELAGPRSPVRQRATEARQ